VRDTAAILRERILAIAAHKLEAAADDIELANSRVSVRGTPSIGMSLRELASLAYFDAYSLPLGVPAGLEATARYTAESRSIWVNATHLCTCEVDVATGEVQLLRYIVSEDCGPMINPNVVEGQISGGVVQGLGGVLLEDFIYDADGNPLTSTFMDYLLPTASEVPDLEIGHILSESTTNPGGFKGLGEGGAIGSHAAVANAVADALAPLGVRLTKTPLGPEDIYALVEAARAATPE
jgi:carbon-monoxide dehydrogenase large subunit